MKYPVTLNQESQLMFEESMWNLGRPTEPFYLPSVLRLEGPLNVVVLEQALNSVIERHAALRTAFVRAGVLIPSEREQALSALKNARAFATGLYEQYFVDRAPIQLQMNFIEFMDPEEQDIEIENILRRSYKTPFDYSKPPFVKAHLFQLSPDRHLLVFMVHHVICDMYSLLIFNRDLVAFYNSIASHSAPQLPAIKRHFMDFAAEQYDRIIDNFYHKMIDYWGKQLLQYHSARINWNDLPSYYRGTTNAKSPKVGTEELALSFDLMESLAKFSRKKGMTFYMLYLSACAIFFEKLMPNNAFAVWANLANKTNLDSVNAIGFFANIHLVGIELSGLSTVNEILSKVRISVLNAIANQSVPLQPVMKQFGPMPQATGTQIVCDMIQMSNLGHSLFKANTIKFQPMPPPEYLLTSLTGLIFRFLHYGKFGMLSASFPEFSLGNDGARSMLKEIANVMRWIVDHEHESIANYKLMNLKEISQPAVPA
jgi:hypothetical protein